MLRAPFIGTWEENGQGFDGRRFYESFRFVLRATVLGSRNNYVWGRPFVWCSRKIKKRFERRKD